MNPILVLSSYGMGEGIGLRYPPVHAFVRELEHRGIPAERVVSYHARSLREHADYLRRLSFVPALIYACGSSLMEVVMRYLAEMGGAPIPVVYWGSHIEDGGQLVNARPPSPPVCGVCLPMPLYHSHRQFRVVRQLFPQLRQVYCVFSTESAFIQGERRDRYLRAREQGHNWILSGSELSAFPSMARLGELADVEVFEHPCTEATRASQAVREIPGATSRSRDAVRACLICCIDCFHVEGAIEEMALAAHEVGVPFIALNLGAFTREHGPVLSFESDLEGAARIAAAMGYEILHGGRSPGELRFAEHSQFLLRCNPALMEVWGIRLSERDRTQLRRSFHQIVEPLPENP